MLDTATAVSIRLVDTLQLTSWRYLRTAAEEEAPRVHGWR